MTSPLLALFTRSLREDARLKITYLARIGLVLMILLFLLTISSSSGWGNAPGLRFFSTVVFINLGFIVLAGLSYFASAISEEKEEMTLGLLRMTNLNPLSILLGKATSRLIGALLLLLAQFPFTLLAISLGGVSVTQILAAYCTLAAFIVFLSSLALLASVICRTSPRAASLTATVLLVVFFFIPMGCFFLALPIRFGALKTAHPLILWVSEIGKAIDAVSPIDALQAILRTSFNGPIAGVQVWSNLALGVGFFLLAWLLFEIFCGEQQEAAPSRSLNPRGKSTWRRIGCGRPWKRAIAWKDFYFIAGGKVMIGIKLLLYAVPLILAVLFTHVGPFGRNGISLDAFGYFTIWVSILVGGLEIAFMAASTFRQERRWKTLSGLAMLPVPIHCWAYQKLLGFLPALIPAAFYCVVGFCCAFENMTRSNWNPSSHAIRDMLMFGAFALAQNIFFLHLVVWLSLYMKRGALPVAIGFHFVAGLFLTIVFAAAFRGDAATVPLTLLVGGAAVALHFAIGRRLEELAAED